MNAFFIIVFVICGIYMVLNFKHDIQMLQQNSYRLERYWRYLHGNLMDTWRLIDVAMLFLVFSTLLDIRLSLLLLAIVCSVKIGIILKKKYKKPLVFTNRVKRIYFVTALLAVGASLSVIMTVGTAKEVWGTYSGPALSAGTMLLFSIFSWLFVMLSILILSPVEKCINKKYWNEASRILKDMPDLKVIGITGSYGKTSTKHFLYRILSEQFEVLMTPGSFNTTMGVIRTVREQLKPYDKIFICEMGAKQRGDIKEICDLVHPSIGIITSVGPMHLETFKTIQNVQATKFELIDSLPEDGFAVINDDFEYCASRIVDSVTTRRFALADGNTKNADYIAEDIEYTPEGTIFNVKGPGGFMMRLSTKLLGSCNISNLLAAVIVALKLGMEKDKIAYAVGKIEPVEHRLSIKRTPGGVTILDDAFNSNPFGSKMALDVLKEFKGGKRIIVTPGMIELGARQDELNKEFGQKIGKCADIAIIVGQYNREAIVGGIKKTDFSNDKIFEAESFNEAQALLAGMLSSGDTVLYENDLPDTFK